MASSSVLLYTLLFLWMLPAIVMIGLYSSELLRSAHRRWFGAPRLSPFGGTSASSTIRLQDFSVGCCPRGEASGEATQRAVPIGTRDTDTATSTQLLVPFVVEDEDGNLHACQWTLCLN